MKGILTLCSNKSNGGIVMKKIFIAICLISITFSFGFITQKEVTNQSEKAYKISDKKEDKMEEKYFLNGKEVTKKDYEKRGKEPFDKVKITFDGERIYYHINSDEILQIENEIILNTERNYLSMGQYAVEVINNKDNVKIIINIYEQKIETTFKK